MSPRFYSYLWIAFAAAAGIFGIAGFFTMLTLVVFGFIAFGLVFAGMICVLPGTVSHPHPEMKPSAMSGKSPRLAIDEAKGRLGVPIGLRPH